MELGKAFLSFPSLPFSDGLRGLVLAALDGSSSSPRACFDSAFVGFDSVF